MTKLIQADQAGIPWLRRLAEPQPKPVSYIPYDIPLRVTPRTIVRLVLPADFATADADRLCRVLQAIAWPGITEEDL
jgi:hypothetical protein